MTMFDAVDYYTALAFIPYEASPIRIVLSYYVIQSVQSRMPLCSEHVFHKHLIGPLSSFPPSSHEIRMQLSILPLSVQFL